MAKIKLLKLNPTPPDVEMQQSFCLKESVTVLISFPEFLAGRTATVYEDKWRSGAHGPKQKGNYSNTTFSQTT